LFTSFALQRPLGVGSKTKMLRPRPISVNAPNLFSVWALSRTPLRALIQRTSWSFGEMIFPPRFHPIRHLRRHISPWFSAPKYWWQIDAIVVSGYYGVSSLWMKVEDCS